MIEVFSYLFAKRPPIRDGGFRAYLYKAARHMALRHKSIRRHHFCLDDLTKEPEGGKLVDEVIRTKERNQILHLCMGELHPDYREALYLTYFEGMSYRQVAEVMGKSVKQITNIMYRGKRASARINWNGRELQMRSHEERIAESPTKDYGKKNDKKDESRRRIVAISCIAACLAVIFGASFVMSGISGQNGAWELLRI